MRNPGVLEHLHHAVAAIGGCMDEIAGFGDGRRAVENVPTTALIWIYDAAFRLQGHCRASLALRGLQTQPSKGGAPDTEANDNPLSIHILHKLEAILFTEQQILAKIAALGGDISALGTDLSVMEGQVAQLKADAQNGLDSDAIAAKLDEIHASASAARATAETLGAATTTVGTVDTTGAGSAVEGNTGTQQDGGQQIQDPPPDTPNQ